jgi:acetyltransferase-like isoleucine patch superfamily enzyme
MTPQKRLVLACIDNPVGRGIIRAFIALATWTDRSVSLLFFLAVLPRAHRTSWCHWSTQVKHGDNIEIGRGVTIGPHCVLGAAKAPIRIGNHVRIGRNVTLETGGLLVDEAPPYGYTAKPINIEDGAVLYANSTILGGVTVGKYSIVSAGCVVTKDVPPFCIVAAARRQEIQRRPSVRRLLESVAAVNEKGS